MISSIVPVLDAAKSRQKKSDEEKQLNKTQDANVTQDEPDEEIKQEHQTQGFADMVGDAACGQEILMEEIVGQMSRTKG